MISYAQHICIDIDFLAPFLEKLHRLDRGDIFKWRKFSRTNGKATYDLPLGHFLERRGGEDHLGAVTQDYQRSPNNQQFTTTSSFPRIPLYMILGNSLAYTLRIFEKRCMRKFSSGTLLCNIFRPYNEWMKYIGLYIYMRWHNYLDFGPFRPHNNQMQLNKI